MSNVATGVAFTFILSSGVASGFLSAFVLESPQPANKTKESAVEMIIELFFILNTPK